MLVARIESHSFDAMNVDLMNMDDLDLGFKMLNISVQLFIHNSNKVNHLNCCGT